MEQGRKVTNSAWGYPISEARKAELEESLQEWEDETKRNSWTDEFDGTVRFAQGPFDRGPLTEGYDPLTGADVFWLAARVLAGLNDDEAITRAQDKLLVEYGGTDYILEWAGQGIGELNLRGANLRGAHLERAILKGAQLEGALLEYSYLEGAVLSRANLRKSMLVRANLAGCILHGTHLEQSWLMEAHLEGSDLSEEAHLEGAQLSNAHLERASLRRARLEGTYLRGASLVGANLEQAWLEHANLSRARLQFANLTQAHLASTDLREAHLEGAILREAYLGGKDVSPEDVERIRQSVEDFPNILRPSDLRLAFFDSATILDDADFGEQVHGSPQVAGVRWGDVNLAVVEWTQRRQGLLHLGKRIEAIELGDERAAHKKSNRIDKPKNNDEWRIGYKDAVRANRQLAIALRSQGLNEDADRFAYKAQKLQRRVLRRQARWGAAFGSWLLDLIAGYGYCPGRSIFAYIIAICAFAGLYLLNGQFSAPHLRWDEAFVLSISSFHGRGFFTTGISLGDMLARLAAGEAILGLLLEITFIATFTNRFFAR